MVCGTGKIRLPLRRRGLLGLAKEKADQQDGAGPDGKACQDAPALAGRWRRAPGGLDRAWGGRQKRALVGRDCASNDNR